MPCEDGGIGNDLMLAAYTLYDANTKLARLSGYEMPPFPAFAEQKPKDRQKHVLDEKGLFSFWLLTGILAFLMLLFPVTKCLYSSFQKKLSVRKSQ